MPTGRSSHSVPRPRGGGVAILGALAITLLLAAGDSAFDWTVWVALAGVLPTAVVGWLDDHQPLSVRARMLAHVVTAATIVPLALSAAAAGRPILLALGAAWWLFVTVSAINVANFMDGIDGLIASQTCLFGIHLAFLAATPESRLAGVIMAGAALGFLLWNWPPARIFMGDVGSGSIGALWVVLGLLVLRDRPGGLVPVFLPLAPVVLDAAVTLARRAHRGVRLSEAHREHLYQRLANGTWGHARVTLLFGLAAACGAGAAHAMVRGQAPWMAAFVYLAAVLLTGFALDRRAGPRPDV